LANKINIVVKTLLSHFVYWIVLSAGLASYSAATTVELHNVIIIITFIILECQHRSANFPDFGVRFGLWIQECLQEIDIATVLAGIHSNTNIMWLIFVNIC